MKNKHNTKNTWNFATLNVRGLKKLSNNDGSPGEDNGLDLSNVIADLQKHEVDAAAIQETHFGDTEFLQKEKGYSCFFANEEKNSSHGTGIIVKESYNPIFTKISGRVCAATFSINDKKDYLFICGYAPHEALAKKDKTLRDTFYAHLQEALSLKRTNTITIVAIDANAQVAYSPNSPPNVIGQFTKGTKTNTNGQKLLEFAAENQLTLTNTLFRHKMSRRTTWTAPYKPFKTKNGEIRRNPTHNQIDFVLIYTKYARFTTNARSYNNINTSSDHNMVVTNLRLELTKLQKSRPKSDPQVNTPNFRKANLKAKYQEKVNDTYDSKTAVDNDDVWQRIVTTCLSAGKEVLGTKEREDKCKDEEVQQMSKQRQTPIRQLLDSKLPEKKSALKKESRNLKKAIDKRLKENEENELDEKMQRLEDIKDDNTKYHYVMRELNRPKKKIPILVKDDEGNIPGTATGKIKIIESYFKKTLAPENLKEEFLEIEPCPMIKKFTGDEIASIAKRLSNDKAAGPDKLQAEFIKNAPPVIFDDIANIYNTIAEKGDVPQALIHGLLCPLQKPGKKKGPPENLRPIILLSILRKILTVALLDRTWDRLSDSIPKTQAAYQIGRGTTEQVLALKLLIEKAITSNNYDVYLLLLDMSKAFDTVNRKTLLKDLQEVLNADETHLLATLTNRPLISIYLDGEQGEGFNTYVGICQGDCLSAVLFIFYLACALKETPEDQVPKDLKAFLELFYADDLTYATTSKQHRQHIKEDTPEKLKRYNLLVNKDKTEEGEAPDKRPPPPPPPPPLEDPGTKILWSPLDWLIPPKTSPPEPSYKNIKLLGTILDTQKDTTARKNKVWQPIQKFTKYFRSKRLSVHHKTRIFRTYVEPVLLYNSETWSLTTTLENGLNSFHRRLLRIAINKRYPKTISNQKLYHITKETPIAKKIQKRRLALFGHILRLGPETPAQKALQYYVEPHKRPVGRPPLTWMSLVTKDLTNTIKHHNIKTPLTKNSIDKLSQLAKVNSVWRQEITRSTKRDL